MSVQARRNVFLHFLGVWCRIKIMRKPCGSPSTTACFEQENHKLLQQIHQLLQNEHKLSKIGVESLGEIKNQTSLARIGIQQLVLPRVLDLVSLLQVTSLSHPAPSASSARPSPPHDGLLWFAVDSPHRERYSQ